MNTSYRLAKHRVIAHSSSSMVHTSNYQFPLLRTFRKVATMGNITGVRTRLPHHPVGVTLPASALGSGVAARPFAVRIAPVCQ